MFDDFRTILHRPKLRDARMILGFSGWMDGGDASTGTVEYLVETLDARKVAEIDAGEFCIYNFPGTMGVSAMFRPYTKIAAGLIEEYHEPANTFYCSERNNLILFEGREPNFRWEEYADCLLDTAAEFGVKMIYFVGSVAGLVPHTRDPRFFCSVSDGHIKPVLEQYGLRFSDYEGPASIVTYLMVRSRDKGMEMVTLVAELPSYVQGKNVKSIEAAARKLAVIIGLPIDTTELRELSAEFETRLSAVVRERPELAELIRKMEDDYDREVLDTEMTDLKDWLEKQDIRLD